MSRKIDHYVGNTRGGGNSESNYDRKPEDRKRRPESRNEEWSNKPKYSSTRNRQEEDDDWHDDEEEEEGQGWRKQVSSSQVKGNQSRGNYGERQGNDHRSYNYNEEKDQKDPAGTDPLTETSSRLKSSEIVYSSESDPRAEEMAKQNRGHRDDREEDYYEDNRGKNKGANPERSHNTKQPSKGRSQGYTDYNYHDENEEEWEDYDDYDGREGKQDRNQDYGRDNRDRDHDRDRDRNRTKEYDQPRRKQSRKEEGRKEEGRKEGGRSRPTEQDNYRFNEQTQKERREEEYNNYSSGRDKDKERDRNDDQSGNYRFRKTDQKKDYGHNPKYNRDEDEYVRKDRAEENGDKKDSEDTPERRTDNHSSSGRYRGRGGWNNRFNNYGFIERKNYGKDKDGKPAGRAQKYYVLKEEEREEDMEPTKKETAEKTEAPEQKKA